MFRKTEQAPTLCMASASTLATIHGANQAVSDLALDPSHCPILGDQKSDIEAGAAVAIGLRFSSGHATAKSARVRLPMRYAESRRSVALLAIALCIVSAGSTLGRS